MRTERSWCGEPGWQKGHHSQQHCSGWTVLRRGCGWESYQSCPTLWTPRTTQSMEFSRTEIFCPLEVCLLNLFQARGGEGWAGEKGPGRWAGRGGKRLWAGRVSIIPVPKETQALGMWIPYCWALPLTCQMLHTKNIPESRLREMTLSPRGGMSGALGIFSATSALPECE